MGEYAEKTKVREQNGNEKRQFLQKQVRQSKRRNIVPKVIPRAIAQEFEQKTGYSSANIRVSESDMPDLFGAKAATQGNEIHFPRGQYQPETAEGRRILKHEMRHTIQQTRNEVIANVDGVVNNERIKEIEADRGFEGVKEVNKNVGKSILVQSNHTPIQCSEREIHLPIGEEQQIPEVNNRIIGSRLGIYGAPNTAVALYNEGGQLLQIRYYDADGKAERDIDYLHSNGDRSHTFPHVHIWQWTNGGPERQRPQPLN